MSAVMIESRPNGATNHGMPAEGKKPSGVRSESRKRSRELREIHALRSGESLANFVEFRCHATQSRSATIGGKRRVHVDVDLDRTPVAGRNPHRDPSTRRTVAYLPRVDRREDVGGLLHAVDRRVAEDEAVTVRGRGLALSFRGALDPPNLEEVAEVGIDGHVGFERRDARTRVLDRPLVGDRVIDADAAHDPQRAKLGVKEPTVRQDLR